MSSTSIFLCHEYNQFPPLVVVMAQVSAIMPCPKFTKLKCQLCKNIFGIDKPRYPSSVYVSVETGLTVNNWATVHVRLLLRLI